MKIEYMIPAHSATVDGSKFNVLGAGIDTFYTSSFPAITRLTVVTKFVFDESEIGKEHKLYFTITLPDKISQFQVGEIDIVAPAPTNEEYPSSVLASMEVNNFEVQSHGVHAIKVYGNGALIGSLKLNMKLMEKKT